ncbi:DNA replication complex subunit Gins51 [Candidatus Harpocratesius sp.]
MDAFTQEKIYINLLRIWERVHSSKKIIKIKQKEEFLSGVRELGKALIKQLSETKNSTIQLIIQKTLDNVRYMVSDILEIRAEKITNSAKTNEFVEESLLFPFELQFYHQLQPSFRGFLKSKQQILQSFNFNGNLSQNKLIDFEDSSQDFENDDNDFIQKYEDNLSFIDSSESISEDINSSSYSIYMSESSYNPKSNNHSTDDSQEDQKFHSDTQKHSFTKESSIDFFKSERNRSKINYQTIISNSDISPFVGHDLIIYGPLAKGEIACIPEKNAQIFQGENMIKLIRSNHK